MRPKIQEKQPQREMFQIELESLIDLEHPLVVLGKSLDWASFETLLGPSYHPTHGAPGLSTRLMVALRLCNMVSRRRLMKRRSAMGPVR